MADRTPKEKVQVEPSPKNPALVGWLEGNFYGPGDYPQRLEVRTMYGPHHERMGPLIKQVLYPPNMVDPADRGGDSEAESSNGHSKTASDKRKAKPNREELVELSHDVLRRIQADADATGKTAVYYVLLSHDLRDPQPYERFPLKVIPQTPRTAQPEEGEEEEEDGVGGVRNLAKGYLLGMKQNQEMFNMLGAMIEGMVDRSDRSLTRAEEALEATRTQLLRQQDVVARAMDLNSERKIKENWEALKVRTVEKGFNLFQGLAPTFMPGLLGPKNGGIAESPESLTLKAFLKPLDEGGSLTKEQVDAVFGAFDDTPEMNLVQPGVLSTEQGKIIFDVANLRVQPAELEKLLPGAPLGMTQEQYVRLQGVFKDSLEQVTPLVAMFGMIMQRTKQVTQSKNPQQTQ